MKMMILINTDDLDIIDSHLTRSKGTKDPDHRQWGERTWLYKGDIVVQISQPTASVIEKALGLS